MRWQATSGLVFVIACASDYDFPPPPAEATSSCVVDVTPAKLAATGTFWFNDQDQLIRVDSVEHNGDGAEPAVHYLAYDAEGRLLETRGPRGEYRYQYSPEQIQVLQPSGTWLMRLEEGRVIHEAGAIEQASDDQWMIDYGYDDAGRITLSAGRGFYRLTDGIRRAYTWNVQYGYDEGGRLASVRKRFEPDPEVAYAMSYAEADGQLAITITRGGSGLARATYNFDASGRVIRAAVDQLADGSEQEIATYSYGDETIDQTVTQPNGTRHVRMLGRCEPPTPVLAPPEPLPIRPYVPWPRLHDVTWIFRVELF